MMKKGKKILVLLIIGGSFFFWQKEQEKILFTTTPTSIVGNIPVFVEPKKKIEKEEGILAIPQIGIKQEYYSFSSSLNTVSYGIQKINACLPSDKCSLVLASHSGTSKIAYFKKLDKLQLNDKATILFQNKTYTYLLKKIVHQEKTGYITIPKNTYDLVLTTCNKENDTIQDLYLFQKVAT